MLEALIKGMKFASTNNNLCKVSLGIIFNARQYTDAIKFEHIETPTMVYCVTPTTQSVISKNDALKDFFADTFWITPLDDDSLKEIMVKSIDKFSLDSSIPFDEATIDDIIEYSLGSLYH
ncbi:MAG: hypothetical protein WCF06_03970 [Nitrososphaeraceae archaeon]